MYHFVYQSPFLPKFDLFSKRQQTHNSLIYKELNGLTLGRIELSTYCLEVRADCRSVQSASVQITCYFFILQCFIIRNRSNKYILIQSRMQILYQFLVPLFEFRTSLEVPFHLPE